MAESGDSMVEEVEEERGAWCLLVVELVSIESAAGGAALRCRISLSMFCRGPCWRWPDHSSVVSVWDDTGKSAVVLRRVYVVASGSMCGVTIDVEIVERIGKKGFSRNTPKIWRSQV